MKFDNGIIYKMFNIHVKLSMEIVKINSEKFPNI